MSTTADSLNAGTSVTAGTTITAGTGITATTGAIAATAGAVTAGTSVAATTAVTAGTDVTATRSLTGAAIYGPTLSNQKAFPGFEVPGVLPPTFNYLRLYDHGTNSYKNWFMYNGTLTAVA